MLELLGRVFFSSMFITSAVNGGELLELVSPKLDTAIETLTQSVPSISHITAKEVQPFYKEILLAAIALELGGGLLFVCGSTLGAYALILFTLVVTFVMHDYWNIPEIQAQETDLINFWKNITIIGALLTIVSLRGQLRQLKSRAQS